MTSITRERALRGARNTLSSIALALCAFALPANAATSYHVQVNGVNLALSQAPFDQGGRVFVPLRAVFEGLNAGVAYDNGTINATSGDRTVQVKIGSNQAIVNGQQTFLDAAPFIQGSTTMVPLRFVSEALGATVDYDATGAINISQAKVPIASGLAINTTLGTELNTATAYVGQPITLNVQQPGSGGAAALSGATIYGEVVDVQAAHQGVNPSLAISVNAIKLAGSSAQQPISAKVVRMNPVQGNNFTKEAGGTLGGMLLGNWIGKSLNNNQGGLIGAAGGYLLTSNSKTNLDVAAGSAVTLQLTDALALK